MQLLAATIDSDGEDDDAYPILGGKEAFIRGGGTRDDICVSVNTVVNGKTWWWQGL